MTPLHAAAYHGLDDVVGLLLEKGAKLDAVWRRPSEESTKARLLGVAGMALFCTPLVTALVATPPKPKLVQRLLAAGAQPQGVTMHAQKDRQFAGQPLHSLIAAASASTANLRRTLMGMLLDAGALPPPAALASADSGDELVQARAVLAVLSTKSKESKPDVAKVLTDRGYVLP